jgi:hypothetical protein
MTPAQQIAHDNALALIASGRYSIRRFEWGWAIFEGDKRITDPWKSRARALNHLASGLGDTP